MELFVAHTYGTATTPSRPVNVIAENISKAAEIVRERYGVSPERIERKEGVVLYPRG